MFRVSADIRYMDGTLAGLDIPGGWSVTYPSRNQALRIARMLKCEQHSGAQIIACGTGNRYQITGGIEVRGV